MSLGFTVSPVDNVISPTTPALSSAVKQMASLLWYNLLSEMNKNGLASGTLGAGGDAFQSMFLWNIAQNDFAKYDRSLTNATVTKIGSRMPVAPVASPAAPTIAKLVELGGAVSVQSAAITPKSDSLLNQATKFAQVVWPAVQQAASQLGVPASAILAQAALETGWGASAPGNNLFGIKAADGQSSTVRATQEVVNGVLTSQNATFRNYSSPAASVADYVQHVQAIFSNTVGQNSVSGFARALQQSGYATDTQYASKIVSIAQSSLMAQVLQAVSGGISLPVSP
ncbi:MAG: glucosaminidase domain-containing protein [Acidocella sp.]|nr:glucosaminidase domain-containing protein [Acidocella sp.]